MREIKVTVIICTYNRCEDLKLAVASVIEQKGVNKNDFEILIIDNKSTDNTKLIIESIQFQTEINLRYIYEENQGLSYARNRGIRESVGQYILFLDDDAIAEEFWMKHIIALFESNLSIGSIGGRIDPNWEIGEPDWLPDEYKSLYSVLDYSNQTIEMEIPSIPFGANVAFRKSIFNEIYPFREDLGRVGSNLLSSEESELIGRVRESYKIMYSPEAGVMHKIPKDRTTKKWICRRSYWQGLSDIARNNKSVMQQSYRSIFGMAHALLFLPLSLNNKIKTTRHIIRICYRAGLFMGIFQYKIRKVGK